MIPFYFPFKYLVAHGAAAAASTPRKTSPHLLPLHIMAWWWRFGFYISHIQRLLVTWCRAKQLWQAGKVLFVLSEPYLRWIRENSLEFIWFGVAAVERQPSHTEPSAQMKREAMAGILMAVCGGGVSREERKRTIGKLWRWLYTLWMVFGWVKWMRMRCDVSWLMCICWMDFAFWNWIEKTVNGKCYGERVFWDDCADVKLHQVWQKPIVYIKYLR